MATSSDRDKIEQWEVLDVPPLIQHSRRKDTFQEEKDNESVSQKPYKKEKEKLCGFLMKFGGGIIQRWQRRWFVYDPRRCLLYYYRNPQHSEHLGNIDIANATFSCGAEDKPVFQISSNDRIYQLAAPDKYAMLFWLQELQSRRREYSKCHDSNPNIRPTSGLLSETEGKLIDIDAVFSQIKFAKFELKALWKRDDDNGDEGDDEEDGFNTPIDKPHTVGEDTACDAQSDLWNFSFSNINKEFKNWRKSQFITPSGEPTVSEIVEQERSPASIRKSESPKTLKKTPSSTKVNDTIGRKKIDFGFSKMVANLRNLNNPSNISSPLPTMHSACQECVEARSILTVLQEAISVAEKEIATRDDVIESLGEQLRLASSNDIGEKSADLEVSQEREHYILQLTRMVKNLTGELNETKIRLEECDQKLKEQMEKENIYKELFKAKDNAIISLTNQIFALEKQCPDIGEDVIQDVEENPTVLDSGTSEFLDYDKLKEACSAYQGQNKFLNSEILELHKLRKLDAEKLTSMNEKLEEQEAEYWKLKSRYLLLLKGAAPPIRGEGRLEAGIVEQLIDDAIKEKVDSRSSTRSPTEYRFSDKYGFYDEFELSDSNALENMAEHIEGLVGDKENESAEVSVGVKWENFLVTQSTAPLVKTEELKALVRLGIPHEFRARVWGDLVILRTGNEKDMAGPGYYQNLLREKQGVYSPSTKQIELDLLRTLPNNKYYDTMESEGTSKLRRILLAYSWHNPAVGYCQGLNRLGAIALLYLDEEMAFWCLVAITEHLMPIDYYSRTLLGAQIDQKVFRDLIEDKFPKLGSHLTALQFDVSLIAFNWFLTVFVDLFPIELTLRVWDTFLFEGSKVLFRYALAVFKLFEEDFLKFRDVGPMFNFFRTLPKPRFNIQKICQIAFTTVNPFSRRNVESKRKYYRPLLQAQLDQFEVMRQEYREKREDSVSSKEDDVLSDDEN